MKHVLICRTGAFGDVCLALPIVHALTQHCRVSWLVRRGNAPLLKLFPQVDCSPLLVDFTLTSQFPSSVRQQIDAERFDALIDLSNWDNVARLARKLTSIPTRAVAYDQTRFQLRHRLRNALPWSRSFNRVIALRGRLHRAEKWRLLIEQTLGISLTVDWPLPPLAHGAGPLKVFVHPHAGKAHKRWPVERFAEALHALARRRSIECRINDGGERERPLADALARLLQPAGIATTRVPFDPSFVALRDALLRSDVVLGVDSGPLHLASLLGTPTVVIYGPYDPGEVSPLWRSTPVVPARRGGGTRDIVAKQVTAALASVVSA